MSSTTVTSRYSGSVALAQDRLGMPPVLFFIMSAAAPLTVVVGLIPTAFAITGVTGIPMAYVAIAIALALFSVGYIAMARHISNAGAFYAYVTQGLGKPMGVATSLVALLTYNALQIPLYGGLGFFLSQALQGGQLGFTANFKWWQIALVSWALVGILGILRIDLSGKVLAVLLCAEVIVVAVLTVSDVLHPAKGGVSFATLAPSNLLKSGVGAGFVVATLSFTGFESAAVFGEETKHPRRTVPMATYVGLALITLLYAGSAWAMSVATGPDNIVQASQQSLAPDQAPLFIGMAYSQLGDLMGKIATILFFTSMIAAMISFHNTVARYTFALGRERVLPAVLGRTGRRSGAPFAASILQSVLGLIVIVLYAANGWDPLLQLFFWVATSAGFGFMILLFITSLAVIGFFARGARGESIWARVLAPALTVIVIGAIGAVALKNFATLLSVDPHSVVRWVAPAVFAAAIVIGIVYALIIKVSRPEVYSAIGLGANTVTGRTTAAAVPEPVRTW
jgi:amino acid transporter